MADGPVVVFEMHCAGRWKSLGALAEMEPCGSVSSHDPDGRHVFLFGWLDGAPGVWRSTGGLDVTNNAFRAVYAVSLERLADLTTGPFERTLVTNAGTVRARWRLVVGNVEHRRVPGGREFPAEDVSCAKCGRDPAAGYAFIGDRRYCHGDDERLSCYEQTNWRQAFGGESLAGGASDE